MPEKKLLSVNMKKFSEDTTMHGFKELYSSKKMMWKIIWILIMTVAMGLTIYQVAKSVQNFIEQPTVTTIQTLEDGELFYPSLSLCFHHWSGWVNFQKVSELNITKSTLIFSLSYLNDVYSNDTFDLREAEQDLAAVMKRNNITKLFDFYKAIAHDLPQYLANDNDDVDNVESMFSNKAIISCKTNMFCYVVEGKKISKLSKSDILSDSKHTSIHFSFKVEKFPIIRFGTYFTSDEYKAYIAECVLIKNNRNITEQNPDLNGLPFPVYLSVYPGSSIKLNQDVDQYKLELRGRVHKWQNQAKAMCIEGVQTISSNYTCFMNCLSNFFLQKCATLLIPFAVQLEMNTLSSTCRRKVIFWNLDGFMVNNSNARQEIILLCNCFNNVFTDSTVKQKECKKECSDGCEKWDYDVSMTFSSDPWSVKQIAPRKYTTIDISYPSEESILVITEINSQSWEAFVANVGGLLGIWLGASIVTFFQTFYLCFCFDNERESNKGIAISSLK